MVWCCGVATEARRRRGPGLFYRALGAGAYTRVENLTGGFCYWLDIAFGLDLPGSRRGHAAAFVRNGWCASDGAWSMIPLAPERCRPT